PGDNIVYLGWKAGTNNLQADAISVSAVGTVLNGNTTVSFLEFFGVGRPGYSGGPVFDQQGNVIALMREAWTKRGINGGDEVLMNRAFSIEPIKARENLTPK